MAFHFLHKNATVCSYLPISNPLRSSLGRYVGFAFFVQRKKFSHTKTNIQEHIKGCPGNPNRVELQCEICKDFTTYWPKKVTEHKKKEHGWKK